MTREFSESEFVSPLYDNRRSFWENVNEGPRELTKEEIYAIDNIRQKIKDLENKHGVNTEVEFLGKRVDAPIALSAGPAYGTLTLIRALEYEFPIVTQKTSSLGYRQVRPHPNVVPCEGNFENGFEAKHEYTGTATNAFAMGSFSAYGNDTSDDKGWAKDLAPFAKGLKQGKGKMLIVSVVYTNPATEGEMIQQYAEAAEVAKEIGADAVEANLSCPNTSGGGDDIYKNPKLCARVAGGIRSAVGNNFPVGLKLGYMKDYSALVEETAHVVNYYAAINTIAGVVKWPDGMPALPHTPKSGVGGDAIRNKAMEALQNLVPLAHKFEKQVVGGGGITAPEHALKYRKELKVDVASVATHAMFDPLIALKIQKDELEYRIKHR